MEMLPNQPTNFKGNQEEELRVKDFSLEKLKNPFFVRETTLEQTLERLKEIEPSKRKIIIYTGVHPNEGTDILTEKYATEWAEKYGATIVCQPTEETPQAIWSKRKGENSEDISPLPSHIILDEEDYADKFSFDNKDTFFVMFHGSPLTEGIFHNPERPRGLGIETSRFSDHPEDFHDRLHPILFSNPRITEGLESELLASKRENIQNEINEERYQNDPLWYPMSPNNIVVEYYYKGTPTKVQDPYFLKLIEKYSQDWRSLLSKENWHRQMNIGPSYLNQAVLSDEDIEVFNSILVKDFEKVLQHISDRLPEKK